MKGKETSWKIYIRNGFARRISQIGEILHSDKLIYNSLLIRQFHDDATRNAAIVIPAITSAFPSASLFLDVGSGSGAFSAELIRQGRHAIGLERSPHGRRLATKLGVESRPFDLLRKPPALVPEKPNVVFSFEVAEHMPDDLGLKLVEYIANFRSPVVFSAAQPGQGGTGHVNERADTYWIQQFEALGFHLEKPLTEMIRSECVKRQASPWFQKNPFVVIP